MSDYPYPDRIAYDILRMIPDDGEMIGSFGCGTGRTEWELIKTGRKVYGYDIAKEAIEIAATRLTSAKQIAPGHLPFEANSLDGLILADVIEHLPNAWMVVKQLAEAVRPGGWVVISVPNMRSIYVLHEFFIRGDWPEEDLGIFDKTHIQMMSKRRLLRWTATCGLTLDRWFDAYPWWQPRKMKLLQWINFLSLGLGKSWLMYQVQGRFRKISA